MIPTGYRNSTDLRPADSAFILYQNRILNFIALLTLKIFSNQLLYHIFQKTLFSYRIRLDVIQQQSIINTGSFVSFKLPIIPLLHESFLANKVTWSRPHWTCIAYDQLLITIFRQKESCLAALVIWCII